MCNRVRAIVKKLTYYNYIITTLNTPNFAKRPYTTQPYDVNFYFHHYYQLPLLLATTTSTTDYYYHYYHYYYYYYYYYYYLLLLILAYWN